MKKPVIGITMGDAAGVGPEIIVKALTSREVYDMCRPLVIGDMKMLKKPPSKSDQRLLLTRSGIRTRAVLYMERSIVSILNCCLKTCLSERCRLKLETPLSIS